MFAPPIAKKKPMAAASSSILQRRYSDAANRQAHATDTNLCQRSDGALTGAEPGEAGRLCGQTQMPLRNAGPAWDFTNIPAFPPDRQPSSPPLYLQPKLAIGAVNDPLEQEADRVAEQVMRMPAPEVAPTSAPPQVSRTCAECEEEEKLQKKPSGTAEAAIGEAPASVHEVLRSPGQPLDATSRAFFEPRFNYDLSRVRIHNDGHSDASARSIKATPTRLEIIWSLRKAAMRPLRAPDAIS